MKTRITNNTREKEKEKRREGHTFGGPGGGVVIYKRLAREALEGDPFAFSFSFPFPSSELG